MTPFLIDSLTHSRPWSEAISKSITVPSGDLDNLLLVTKVVGPAAGNTEPSSIALVGIGGLVMLGYGWRRRCASPADGSPCDDRHIRRPRS